MRRMRRYEQDWGRWRRAVTLFHQRVARAYQEMIAEAPPVEDARSGVAEVKRAATVFEAHAREYADCVWAFADGRPGGVTPGGELAWLAAAMENALGDYRGEGPAPG